MFAYRMEAMAAFMKDDIYICGEGFPSLYGYQMVRWSIEGSKEVRIMPS